MSFMRKLSEWIKNLIDFKKPAVWITAVSVIVVAALVIGFMLYRMTFDSSTGLGFREFMGHITELTLDDVRALAKKGDALEFEDLKKFKGTDLSSNMNYHVLLYKVEDNYRLIVHMDGKKIDSTSLERVWDNNGGSGIDIRYSDVDEFIKNHPLPEDQVIGKDTLTSWQDIEVGMSREEVHKIMGEPVGMLSGLYGDIYKLDEGSGVIIYYDSESRVYQMKLTQLQDKTSSQTPGPKLRQISRLIYERYSWLDGMPELYEADDDLETRLMKYSDYLVSKKGKS